MAETTLTGIPRIGDTALDFEANTTHGPIKLSASATPTLRAVFVIDPKRVVRALVYYPMNVGRNVDEIKRLVTALQMADQHGCAMPVNWKPGEKVIVPPPKTVTEVEERKSNKN